MASHKPVHTIILDAGPILKNDPSVSTLLSKSENLFTVPTIISEIRDPAARSRVEITLLPFLTIRNPKSDSIKFVRDFARSTGDLPVLSAPDIQVLALAYELECEQNNGDWRLRNTPGQKKTNGLPPKLQSSSTEKQTAAGQPGLDNQPSSDTQRLPPADEPSAINKDAVSPHRDASGTVPEEANKVSEGLEELQIQSEDLEPAIMDEPPQQNFTNPSEETVTEEQPEEPESESSDSEGWITPSNLKKQQAKDDNASTEPISDDKILQVGTLTGDFAMQVRISTDLALNSLAKMV